MDIIQRDDCTAFETKDGSEIREIMAYRNSACQRTSLAEATVHPGKSTTPHRHPETEEIYYFLSGSGHMQVADEEADVRPGDAVLIPPGAAHKLTNTGSEDLVLLCICCPPYEDKDTHLLEEIPGDAS
jgi:mannose-6-phosphate isomerase-like protein (cupin superfamily)